MRRKELRKGRGGNFSFREGISRRLVFSSLRHKIMGIKEDFTMVNDFHSFFTASNNCRQIESIKLKSSELLTEKFSLEFSTKIASIAMHERFHDIFTAESRKITQLFFL